MKHLLYNIYILMLALSLGLHIFNGGGDGLKPFHITALLACLLSYRFVPKKGRLFKMTTLFLLFSFISAAISLTTPTLSKWLTLFIVVYSCYGMAYVNLDKVLNWMIILIPIDVLALFRFSIVQPDFRFKAYYSDPNYMCTTLLCFLFLCIMIYLRRKNMIIKGIMVASMVLIIALIAMTVSRTGIFCATIMILSVSFAALKKHFVKLVLVAAIVFFAVQYYASEFVDAQWGLLYDRAFKSSDSVENAGDVRLSLSMQNIYFILDHPQFILFGLGPGSTHPDGASQIPGLQEYRNDEDLDLIDHNTWTSFFSEQGLLAFICLFCIFLIVFKNIRQSPSDSSKYMIYAYFFSLVLFSLSISQKTYLPFWWGAYLLNNKKMCSLCE